MKFDDLLEEHLHSWALCQWGGLHQSIGCIITHLGEHMICACAALRVRPFAAIAVSVLGAIGV
eukprot:695802-Amphidinium_carterae.1